MVEVEGVAVEGGEGHDELTIAAGKGTLGTIIVNMAS